MMEGELAARADQCARGLERMAARLKSGAQIDMLTQATMAEAVAHHAQAFRDIAAGLRKQP